MKLTHLLESQKNEVGRDLQSKQGQLLSYIRLLIPNIIQSTPWQDSEGDSHKDFFCFSHGPEESVHCIHKLLEGFDQLLL